VPAAERSDAELVESIDDVFARISSAERDLFRLLAEADRRGAWRDSGARTLAHWVSMRFGITHWKALRWVAAARALENLPIVAKAFAMGWLGIDKVVELTRFATPESERRLTAWACRVGPTAVRERADREVRRSVIETRAAERSRSLTWWYGDDGRLFFLTAQMSAAQGAHVAAAIERVAAEVPEMPGEEGHVCADARRADALAALCSARLAAGADPDRSTVVIHAQLDGLQANARGCEVEGGPVIHPDAVRRLLCNARVQTVVEDEHGDAVAVSRPVRQTPAWMLRQLRYRDRGCVFPGCGSRRFTHAHHVRWWRHGGRTELGNLALVCGFHHRLVHEHGWNLKRATSGEFEWLHPDGSRYHGLPGIFQLDSAAS
jgi:hypothetical protein